MILPYARLGDDGDDWNNDVFEAWVFHRTLVLHNVLILLIMLMTISKLVDYTV